MLRRGRGRRQRDCLRQMIDEDPLCVAVPGPGDELASAEVRSSPLHDLAVSAQRMRRKVATAADIDPDLTGPISIPV